MERFSRGKYSGGGSESSEQSSGRSIEFKADMYIWRPIVAKLLRFSDYRFMSFTDLVDAHEILDMQDYVQEMEMKKLELERMRHGR